MHQKKKKFENKMFTKFKDMWQKFKLNLTGHYLSIKYHKNEKGYSHFPKPPNIDYKTTV